MTPTISQRVKFSASPKTLFEMYMVSKKHAATTGAPAKLSRRVGGAWHAHGGAIGGKNLQIIPGKLIVQAWRAGFWKKDELSILIMSFENAPGGTVVEIVHLGVPQHDQKGVRKGLAKILLGALEEISRGTKKKEEIAWWLYPPPTNWTIS